MAISTDVLDDYRVRATCTSCGQSRVLVEESAFIVQVVAFSRLHQHGQQATRDGRSDVIDRELATADGGRSCAQELTSRCVASPLESAATTTQWGTRRLEEPAVARGDNAYRLVTMRCRG